MGEHLHSTLSLSLSLSLSHTHIHRCNPARLLTPQETQKHSVKPYMKTIVKLTNFPSTTMHQWGILMTSAPLMIKHQGEHCIYMYTYMYMFIMLYVYLYLYTNLSCEMQTIPHVGSFINTCLHVQSTDRVCVHVIVNLLGFLFERSRD